MRLRSVLAMMVCGVVCAAPVLALEFREEPYRVGIVDVGSPRLLSADALETEIFLNSALRDWIKAYGRPDYAEYQKVEIDEPFHPYEVRLYYIEGRRYVAFGRVQVAPSLTDFGVRKFIGKLDSAMLQRLLTARPPAAVAAVAPASPVTYSPPVPGDVYVAPPVVDLGAAPYDEEIVVEEVIEIEPEVVTYEDEVVVEDGAVVIQVQPVGTVVEEIIE